jgi:uncharacterized protein YcbX
MPSVAALYRYPVKGFTPELRESLTVLPHGRIAGDRALAFRFATVPAPDLTSDGHEWWGKRHVLSLMEFPCLARLTLTVDDAGTSIRITEGATTLAEAGLDSAGRDRLVSTVTDYVRATPEGAVLDTPGKLPLHLIGDLEVARFQDRPGGFVTLHGRGSLLSLGEVLDGPADERRFRSNIALEGIEAWAELDWQRLRIGAVEFRVEKPVVRCIATHANPDTGERDAAILTTLTRTFGNEQPTFGVLLLPTGDGGEVHVGDEVTILE